MCNGESPATINLLLMALGFQTKVQGGWELTEEGKEHGRVFDVNKWHEKRGTPVTQIKWSDSVVGYLKV